MEWRRDWKKRICNYLIESKHMKPHLQLQNKLEHDIWELIQMIRRFQEKAQSTQWLWNYLVDLCAKIGSFVAGCILTDKDNVHLNRSAVGRQMCHPTWCMGGMKWCPSWTTTTKKNLHASWDPWQTIKAAETEGSFCRYQQDQLLEHMLVLDAEWESWLKGRNRRTLEVSNWLKDSWGKRSREEVAMELGDE
jgi:hypothetical protein